MMRICGRRPSSATSLVPMTWASISATAADRGSMTSAWTVGSGSTSKPTPIDRPTAAVTFPAASKVTFNSPIQRYPPGAVITGTIVPEASSTMTG